MRLKRNSQKMKVISKQDFRDTDDVVRKIATSSRSPKINGFDMMILVIDFNFLRKISFPGRICMS